MIFWTFLARSTFPIKENEEGAQIWLQLCLMEVHFIPSCFSDRIRDGLGWVSWRDPLATQYTFVDQDFTFIHLVLAYIVPGRVEWESVPCRETLRRK